MVKKYREFVKENYKTFEAVIQPSDFDQFFIEIENIDNYEEMLDLASEYDIEFVDYNTFYNHYLTTDKEREVAPQENYKLTTYIKFALYSKNDTYVFVITDEFKNNFKAAFIENKDLFNEILRHESVHRTQHRKSNGKSYSLKRSPSEPISYFSHYTEMMAYAISLVDQLTVKGLSKEEMLQELRMGKLSSWVNNVYSRLDNRTKKKFYNYVYSYIMTTK